MLMKLMKQKKTFYFILLCVYLAPTSFSYIYILLSWPDFVFDTNVTCVLRRAIQCLLG
jgi:hypothetical protein